MSEVNSKVDQVQEVLTKVEKIAEQLHRLSRLLSLPPQSYASVSKKTPTHCEIYGRFTESNREKK